MGSKRYSVIAARPAAATVPTPIGAPFSSSVILPSCDLKNSKISVEVVPEGKRTDEIEPVKTPNPWDDYCNRL